MSTQVGFGGVVSVPATFHTITRHKRNFRIFRGKCGRQGPLSKSWPGSRTIGEQAVPGHMAEIVRIRRMIISLAHLPWPSSLESDPYSIVIILVPSGRCALCRSD